MGKRSEDVNGFHWENPQNRQDYHDPPPPAAEIAILLGEMTL